MEYEITNDIEEREQPAQVFVAMPKDVEADASDKDNIPTLYVRKNGVTTGVVRLLEDGTLLPTIDPRSKEVGLQINDIGEVVMRDWP